MAPTFVATQPDVDSPSEFDFRVQQTWHSEPKSRAEWFATSEETAEASAAPVVNPDLDAVTPELFGEDVGETAAPPVELSPDVHTPTPPPSPPPQPGPFKRPRYTTSRMSCGGKPSKPVATLTVKRPSILDSSDDEPIFEYSSCSDATEISV